MFITKKSKSSLRKPRTQFFKTKEIVKKSENVQMPVETVNKEAKKKPSTRAKKEAVVDNFVVSEIDNEEKNK